MSRRRLRYFSAYDFSTLAAEQRRYRCCLIAVVRRHFTMPELIFIERCCCLRYAMPLSCFRFFAMLPALLYLRH